MHTTAGLLGMVLSGCGVLTLFAFGIRLSFGGALILVGSAVELYAL
jgi:hypothetical protein